MKKTPIAIAVTAALCVTAGTAFAAGQYGEPSSPGATQSQSQSGGQTGAIDKSFMELDTNLDGMVSQDEANQSPVLSDNFSTADADADGNLDRSEFSAFEQAMSGDTSGGGASGAMEDSTDGAAGGMGGGAAGAQSQSQGGTASFSSLDANSDGMLSRDEAMADPNLASSFSAADSDQDGAISQSEFSAFEASSGTSGDMEDGGDGTSIPTPGATPSTPPGIVPDNRSESPSGSSAIDRPARLMKASLILAQGYGGSDSEMQSPDSGGASGGMGGSTGSAPTTALPSFSALDVNGDGQISQDEASASATLSGSFDSVDADQDGAVSQSEFSAFEATGGADSSGDMGGASGGSDSMGGGTSDSMGGSGGSSQDSMGGSGSSSQDSMGGSSGAAPGGGM